VETPKHVSVVLGGGGAKGFVHLGVLQAILNRGYDIRAIFGTSIGSIIGALFAYHFAFLHLPRMPRAEAQQEAARSVSKLLLKTNFIHFADISFSPFRRGFMKGARFRRFLETQLLDPREGIMSGIRFSDLKKAIDLHVTITDAMTGNSVLCGPADDESPNTFVAAAVRASMSIQGLFLEDKIDYNGQEILCWDGGVTGNCRFDLSCAKYPEALTVASSVTYRGDPQALPNSLLMAAFRPLRVADRSADFWLRQIESLTETLLPAAARERLVIVRPDLAGVRTTSFLISKAKRQTLVRNGCVAADRELRKYEGNDAVAMDQKC